MKVINIARITLIAVVIATGCDIVEGPYVNPIEIPTDSNVVVQKVLLEEFTGHQCPNCPAGAEEASQLHSLYEGRFIVIAYHAGFFARTSSDFPIDYRTSVGNELNTHFGVVSYPAGLINRKGGNVVGVTEWSGLTSEVISQEPSLRLTISKTYNETTRLLNVTVTAKALAQLSSMNVSVFITESGMVSPQKTSNDPNYPSGVIPDYQHNHVFRASMNGTWGNEIFNAGAEANKTETLEMNYTISNDWNAENIHIVCFAYSNSTGEVIQVEEVNLIDS